MKQGEAVFQAINTVLNGSRIEGAVNLSKSQLTEVHSAVYELFASGQVVHAKNPSDAELRKYIPGLVNNWMRKDPRLNGGIKYTPKNPGSRAGSGDPQVKAMKTLLSTIDNPDERAKIKACIDARLQELKPKKAIDITALPEELQHLVK